MRRAFVALLAAVAVGLPAATVGAGPGDFADASGDAGSAPDVTTVSVSDDDGNVDINIAIANRTAPTSGDRFEVDIDADRNPATGKNGVDAVVTLDAKAVAAGSVTFSRWNGSSFVQKSANLASGVDAGSDVSVVIAKSALRSPNSFDFTVRTATGAGGAGASDVAPDAGTWTYPYTVAPPPTVTRMTLTFSPRDAPSNGVRVGERLAVTGVTLTLNTGQVVQATSVACIPLLHYGVNLLGPCSWRVPQRLRGKQFQFLAEASDADTGSEKSVSIRVRKH